MGRIEVVPEAYIEFTAPRGGITGRVVQAPAPYEFTRFVAFIMSDGADYDFTGNIAPCWRVIFGNGNLETLIQHATNAIQLGKRERRILTGELKDQFHPV